MNLQKFYKEIRHTKLLRKKSDLEKNCKQNVGNNYAEVRENVP